MKPLLLISVVLAVVGWGGQARAQTLGDVCANYSGPNQGQMAALCQGAWSNGNAALIQDNNSRVYGSVAVVSAYGCMAGDSGACSSAVDNGNQAYANHNGSKSAFQSAQWTTQSALDLASSTQTAAAGSNMPATGAGLGAMPSLPAACASAVSGGAIGDRIACAVATDPAIPAVVQSPQFLAQFQNATGIPLQEAINKSQAEMMNLAPLALEHALGTLKDKVSPSDLLSKKNMLLGALMQKTGAGKGMDANASQALLARATSATTSATTAKNLSAAIQAENLADASRTLASVDDPENHPEISLFARVTHQYRQSALFTGDMALPSWPTATR